MEHSYNDSMTTAERVARMDAAMREIHETFGSHIFSPPPAQAQQVAAAGAGFPNRRRQSQILGQSFSFEDLRLSVGASTLARHLQTGSGSQKPSRPLTRASSVDDSVMERPSDTVFSLDHEPAFGYPLQRTASSKYSTVPIPRRYRNDLTSGANNGGWESTFSIESQVPRPLNVTPRQNPVTAADSDDIPLETLGQHHAQSPNRTFALKPAKALPKPWTNWTSRQNTNLTATTAPAADHEIPPHPAVRVPTRGNTPRDVGSPTIHHQTQQTNSREESVATPAQDVQNPRNGMPRPEPQNVRRNPDISMQVDEPAEHSTANGFPWLQAFAGFLVFFNVWGMILSYGALQGYYGSERLRGTSPTLLALIGSFQPFSLYVFAPFSVSAVWGNIRFRTILHGGSVLLVLCIFSLAWCTQAWQFFLVQGVLSGTAMSMIFKCTMESLASTCGNASPTRYGRVTAFAASGSTFGTIAFVLIVRSIDSPQGFPSAVRIIGFVSLGTLLPANLVLSPVLRPTGAVPRQISISTTLFTLSTWRSYIRRSQSPFHNAATGVFLASLGLLLPFYSIVQFGLVSQHLSGYSACTPLMAMAAATLPGFVAPPLLLNRSRQRLSRRPNTLSRVDRILDILLSASFIASSVVFVRVGSGSRRQSSQLALVVVYGFVSAALNGIDLPMVSRITCGFPRDARTHGGTRIELPNEEDGRRETPALTRLKDIVICVCMSVGFLTGPLIGGWLVEVSGGLGSQFVTDGKAGSRIPADQRVVFMGSELFTGATLLVGGVCFACARWQVSRRVPRA